MTTHKDKAKHNDKTLYVISNAEMLNKFQLTISSAAFGFIYYLISNNKGWTCGLKISIIGFVLAIFLTMLALIITVDYPEPEKYLDKIIWFIDWLAFIVFSMALFLTCYSIIAI